MMTYALWLLLPFRDLALAVYDWITRRRRRCYTYDIDVRAPPAVIRRLVHADDVTFQAANLRIVDAPLPGIEHGRIANTYVGDVPGPRIAYLKPPTGDDDRIENRYLRDLSEPSTEIGEDDVLVVVLEPLGVGVTRVRLRRELTHVEAGTRLSVPLGLRTAGWLYRTQAEADVAAGPGPSPAVVTKAAGSIRSQAIWGLAAFASFWALFGWQDALVLVLLVLLHEGGHAVAMQLTGAGVGFVRLVPFFGGMAAPKRHYVSEWQAALVALAGPGLSLVPTALLLSLAWRYESQTLAGAAVMFAIINGANLLPVVPLDGGVILRALAGSAWPWLGRAMTWLGAALFLVAAIWLQSILLGLVFLLALLQAAYQSSMSASQRRRRMSLIEASVMIVGFLLTALAYAWLTFVSMDIDQALKRETRAAARLVPVADGPATMSAALASCRLPVERQALLRLHLAVPPRPTEMRRLPAMLALADSAGDGDVIAGWLQLNADRSIGAGRSDVPTGRQLSHLLAVARSATVDELRAYIAAAVAQPASSPAKDATAPAARATDATVRKAAADASAATVRYRLEQTTQDILLIVGRPAEAAALRPNLPQSTRGLRHSWLLLRSGAIDAAVRHYDEERLERWGSRTEGIATRLVAAGRPADALAFIERVLARTEGEGGAAALVRQGALAVKMRLAGPDVALPALAHDNWSWELLTAWSFKIARLEAAGRPQEAKRIRSEIDRVTRDVDHAHQERRLQSIADVVAWARALVLLDAGRTKAAVAALSVSGDVPPGGPDLRDELMRGRHWKEVAAFDAGRDAEVLRDADWRHRTTQRTAALLPTVWPREKDAHRLLEYARAAARWGDGTASRRFLADAEQAACSDTRPAVLRKATLARLARDAYLVRAVLDGRLPPAALELAD